VADARNVLHEQVKKFLPFADGTRSCVGLSMGQMAYMAAMARLLSNFSFKLHPEVSRA
jgi:cytochrome P450